MNERFLRLPTRAVLLAGAAALASSMVAGTPAQAAFRAATPTNVQTVAPRAVNPLALPKAGARTGRHLVLPAHHPNISHGAQAAAHPTTAKGATSASPRTFQAGTTGGFAGDSYNQQTAAYPGSPFSDQAVVPPDNGTAVGSAFIVEFLNSSGWVYLRNNGGAGPVYTWDLNSFFVSSADQANGFFESDPRVVWDPTSSRWFASSLSFACTNNQCTAIDSREYVAVSSSADPTQPWTVYTVFNDQTDSGNNPGLGDQPRMGVTSDKVLEFWDYYANSQASGPIPEGGVILNKAQMVAGATANVQRVFHSAGDWFGMVPAYDSSASDAWLVYNNTDGNLNSTCSQSTPGDCYLGVLQITGAAGSAVLTDNHLGYGGNPTFYAPSNCTAPPQLFTSCDDQAPQPGATGPAASAAYLDANDDRITVAAIQGTTIWATANTACGANETNPVCVRMFKITTGSPPTLDQNVNITGPSGDSVYFGAPAFDNAGDVVVGMTMSSSTLAASLAISGETAAASSFSTPILVSNQGTGAGTYDDTQDGFIPPDCVAGGPGTGQPCRWGDYSGNQPDVCDPTFTWVSQEYAAPPTQGGVTNNWGTWIAPVTFGSSTSPANCAGAATVSAVAPSSGSSGCVNVTGTGFTNAAHVYFGSSPASFSVNSDTNLTANIPSGPSGTVHLSVVNGSGDSMPVSGDQFTYTSSGVAKCVPTVTSVTPNTGPLAGEQVTVGGSGFIPGTTTVTINGSSATVGTTTSTSMSVTLPAEPAGTYDVQASNGGSQSPINRPGDQFTYVDGGYTMDAYGGVHPFGVTTPPPARTDGPYWSGWQIARGMSVRPDRGSGYIVDGWGGVHPFGGAPSVTATSYWPGWDIARGIALDPCDTTHSSGYVLDGWGGIHPFGPHASSVSGYAYWPGWDIARAIVVNPTCGQGGYTLDGWGGIHPFGTGGNAVPATPTGGAYWQGWDIARALVLTGNGKGVELDGWGGLHGFGGQATPGVSSYWPGWDIARALVMVPGVTGGYTLDGWGGLHPFSGAPDVTVSDYTPGQDIFRAAG